MSDWDPVHHEDSPEPERPSRTNGAAAKEKAEDKPVQAPVGIMLQMPAELIAVLSHIAGLQAEIVSVITGQSAAIVALSEQMSAAADGASGEMSEALAVFAEQSLAQTRDIAGLAEQQAALAKSMGAIEQAIRAPRSVSLERDKDGRAVSATSEVKDTR